MQTTNNVNLSAVDKGSGVPLVFVHGFPFSRAVWREQIDAFQSSHRVIAPDLPGFGNSDARPGPATMEQYADDVRSLLEQLATGPVVLVGHSMGGYVALAFERRCPEMLRGLVLVGTKAGPDSTEAAAGRRAMADKVKTAGVQAVVEAMAPKMLDGANHDASMMEDVREFMASSTPVGVVGALLGMAGRADATAHLGQIVVPTLVITGADDMLVAPEESTKLAEAIPGAQLEVIAHAGHLVAFEQAEPFNRALEGWLNREGLGGSYTSHPHPAWVP